MNEINLPKGSQTGVINKKPGPDFTLFAIIILPGSYRLENFPVIECLCEPSY